MDTNFFRPAALCALGLLISAPALQAQSITMPKGEEVVLVFDQPVSSKTAKEGDRVSFHVADNVMSGSRVLAPAGTKVMGTISKVEKRKRFGVNAKLHIALDPMMVNGTSVPLEPKAKGKYTGSRTDKAGMVAGAGALVLGPVGLVGGYFVVGKPIQIHTGDRIVTEVASDTVVR